LVPTLRRKRCLEQRLQPLTLGSVGTPFIGGNFRLPSQISGIERGHRADKLVG
jgi:hypothetical protein